MTKLLCFGLGYSATAFAALRREAGWSIAATATSDAGAARIAALGYEAFRFDGTTTGSGVTGSGIEAAIATATHAVMSAPPGAAGDPVLLHYADALAKSPSLRWMAYLSTIGVYGDWAGGWVDETSPLRPRSDRSQRRVAAEQAWLDLGRATGKTVLIFRLAGIYGPGRSAIDNILDGSARRVIKPGQVFNRIHRDDIAGILEAGVRRTPHHAIFNVTDDEPAPPQDVVAYAAELLRRPVPPDIPYEQAALSPMGASFYAENKRVSNARAKGDLGWRLIHPSYRDGLSAIAAHAGVAKTG